MVTNQQPIEDLKFVGLLQEGLAYLDSIIPTYINQGGCGVFAGLLADKFDTLGIKHQIIALQLTETEPQFQELKNFKKCGNINKNCGAAHIVVEVEGIFIDSTGFVDGKQIYNAYDKIELTRDELTKLVDGGGWNPVFDRDCIPEIKEKLDEVFSHVYDYKMGIFKFPKRNSISLTKKTGKALHRMISPFASIFGHSNNSNKA